MLGDLLRQAALAAAYKALAEGSITEANKKLWFVRCVAVTPRAAYADCLGVVHFETREAPARTLALNASHSY